jgi:hypothetical protein
MDSYDYTPSAVLIGEVDGLRIISSTTCDFLQKVPGTVFTPSTFGADKRLLTGGL